MSAVEVTITGMLYDKLARTTQNVVLIGEATLTGLGIGGGPIIPPGGPPSGPVDPGYGKPMPPSQIWGGRPGPGDGGSWVPKPPYVSGGPIDPYPDIGGPGPQPPSGARPEHPIYYPPNVPPVLTPPVPPNPGDPTTPVAPPPGSPGWPVQPITVPDYVVINYPGIGPVVVAKPIMPAK